MVVIYRPPPSHKNKLNVFVFLDEFISFLEKLITTTDPLVIVGDFNFHLDNQCDRAAALFQELLDAFSLVQHIHEPTHRKGHTLDLIITRIDDKSVKNVRISDPLISDHAAVFCEISSLKKPSFQRKQILHRKLRSIDSDRFIQDIEDSALMNRDGSNDVSMLADCYDNTFIKNITGISRTH